MLFIGPYLPSKYSTSLVKISVQLSIFSLGIFNFVACILVSKFLILLKVKSTSSFWTKVGCWEYTLLYWWYSVKLGWNLDSHEEIDMSFLFFKSIVVSTLKDTISLNWFIPKAFTCVSVLFIRKNLKGCT